MLHYLNKVLATPGTLIFFLFFFFGGGGGSFKDFLRKTLVFITSGKVLFSEINVS